MKSKNTSIILLQPLTWEIVRNSNTIIIHLLHAQIHTQNPVFVHLPFMRNHHEFTNFCWISCHEKLCNGLEYLSLCSLYLIFIKHKILLFSLNICCLSKVSFLSMIMLNLRTRKIGWLIKFYFFCTLKRLNLINLLLKKLINLIWKTYLPKVAHQQPTLFLFRQKN